MFFFFKKPKIVIDCFTPFESVFNAYKIRKAMSYFPEDIKSLDSYVETTERGTNISYEISTIKKCPGILNLYKTGIIIPMWTDFICQPQTFLQNTSSIGLMAEPFSFVQHPKVQYPTFAEDIIHIKLNGVWNINSKENVKFMWNPAYWNLKKHWSNFDVLPGIIDYTTQSQTNLNLFIKKNSESFKLLAGTPIVHITPIDDREIEPICHLVSMEEYCAKNTFPEELASVIPNKHKRYLKHVEVSKKLDKKCPFGFGK